MQRIVDNLLDGLGAIADFRTLVFTLVWSLIAWSTSLTTFYVLHLALGIEVNYAQSVPLGVSLAALGIALPFSIAAVGPFEAAIIVTGQLVGMDSLAAISLGFLFHGLSVFGYIVFGSASLLALGVSPGTAAAEDSDPPQALISGQEFMHQGLKMMNAVFAQNRESTGVISLGSQAPLNPFA